MWALLWKTSNEEERYAWDEHEENRGAIRTAKQLGKMRKRMGQERKSEKSTAGHHSQRHKSRLSQLDSNANPAQSQCVYATPS